VTDDLAAWLNRIGLTGCRCRYAWKGLGVLYGVSLGNGWVRLDDGPACPLHGGT
jgi:hypothetical protein